MENHNGKLKKILDSNNSVAECFRKLVIFAISENEQFYFKVFNSEMKRSNFPSEIRNCKEIYGLFTKFCCDHIEDQYRIALTTSYEIMFHKDTGFKLISKSNSSEVSPSLESCSCSFYVSTRIVCRHIIFLRNQKGLLSFIS